MQYIPKWLHNLFGSDVFEELMRMKGVSYRQKPKRHTQKITLEGNNYFIKQFFAMGWPALLKRMMQARGRVSDARTEWHAIKALECLGISTTPAVAYAVDGKSPATKRSFLLTSALENQMSLEDVVKTKTFRDNPLLKRDILLQVANITKKLHDHGMNHRDLYICHFLLPLDKQGQIPLRCETDLYLIDLHRMQTRKKIPECSRIKDLAALLFSSFDVGLTQRDYFRFLKIYTGLSLREALGQNQKMWKAIFNRAQACYQRKNPDKPFVISWPIHKMLRILSGHRWVIQSTWQGKPVVIKIFASQRKAMRALNNFKKLHAKGILMPELLAVTRDQTQHYTCLIFEEVPHVPLLEQAQASPVETCKTLIEILAKQHEMGIVQGDLHVNNFIVTHDIVYTIDTDKITFKNDALNQQDSLKNLAQLVAQFFPQVRIEVPELYAFYCEQRNWMSSKVLLKQFQEMLETTIYFRRQKFLRKIFRGRRSVKAKQTFSSRALWIASVDSPAFQAFINDPENVFNATNAEFLKRGNSRTVVKAEIDGQPYVVKRYNLKNTRYALSRLMRPTGAAHAWYMAHLFQFLHIPTVPPVALIEKRWGPLRREAYLVTKFVEGEVLSKMEISQTQRAEIQAKVLEQIASMHAEHITHGDLKPANVLISKKGPIILDLDSTKTHYWPFLKERRANKDNQRFLSEMVEQLLP